MNTGTGYQFLKTSSGQSDFSYGRFLKNAVLGTIIGLFAAVILMLVFSIFISMAVGDPGSVLDVFTAVAASIGAFSGGYYASRTNGSKGLFCGLASGFLLSVILLIVMLFASGNENDTGKIVMRLIIIICQIIFGGIGGIMANNRKPKKRTSSSRNKK